MAKDQTFAKVAIRCSTALAVAAVVAGGWTVVALLYTTGLAPWAVGFVSGSIIFSSSITEPGHPCVMISGNASSWNERTWMK